ncbi:MAG: hypothetical protein ABI769_10455 [Pseudomonadota bacterium]
MKNSSNTAKLLELPYAPEAEQYLDELERSGQFRVGLEAEIDDAGPGEAAASSDYAWGRGSGHVSIQDWWTTGRVDVRVGGGIAPADISLARINDALVIRTRDGLDRLTLEGYLGLIPDASTLRIIFTDGAEWTGAELLTHVSSWVTEVDPRVADPEPTPPGH